MSASDAYVEWWAAGVDPVVLVDRLLDAGFRWGLEPGSVMVEVLDEEGESTPTPVREFRDLLRLADGRVAFQLWLDDGGYLVVTRWRVLLGGERRVVDRVTCYLDALLPYEFDGTVTVAASLVTDFPERTLVWVLDGSNDTAAFDWQPVAASEPVAVPWAPVVVTRADSMATAPGRAWSQDVPAPGLQSIGWPAVEGGDPVSWYWWCRR